MTFNPIPVGLIYDYFLWGGGASNDHPSLKSALIMLEKFWRQKNMGGIIFTQNVKNTFYLAKTPSKIKRFVECFVVFESSALFIDFQM